MMGLAQEHLGSTNLPSFCVAACAILAGLLIVTARLGLA